MAGLLLPAWVVPLQADDGDATGAAPAVATPTPWAQTVASFADALRAGDAQSVRKLLDKPLIHRFSAARPGTLEPLFALATRKLQTIAIHAYTDAELPLAGDLATDFQQATFVSDARKAKMALADESQTHRANVTATAWVDEALDIKPGDAAPVGVIVLSHGDAQADLAPIFVLLKGARVGDTYVITQIVWGDPTTAK